MKRLYFDYFEIKRTCLRSSEIPFRTTKERHRHTIKSISSYCISTVMGYLVKGSILFLLGTLVNVIILEEGLGEGILTGKFTTLA